MKTFFSSDTNLIDVIDVAQLTVEFYDFFHG